LSKNIVERLYDICSVGQVKLELSRSSGCVQHEHWSSPSLSRILHLRFERRNECERVYLMRSLLSSVALRSGMKNIDDFLSRKARGEREDSIGRCRI
jgi:hypothetical protein